MIKISFFLNFFAQIFGQFKKKAVLLHRFSAYGVARQD